jgi:hypothetical protein
MREHGCVSGEDLMHAVQTLIDLDHGDRAQQAAVHLPDQLPVADLLRAADGAQRLARALAALRHHTSSDAAVAGYDPHDVRSLYS